MAKPRLAPEPPNDPADAATPAMRRQERTRQRVFEEAAHLFEENGGEEGGGFERTTVEAIADHSDISTRTFFRYFESKIDVIYLDLRRSLDDYVGLLAKRLTGSDDPLFAAMAARIDQIALFVQVAGNEQRLRRAFSSQIFRDRHTVWLSTWEQRIAQVLLPHLDGRTNPLLHAEVITSLAIRISSLATFHWAAAAPGRSVVEHLIDSYTVALELAARPDLVASLVKLKESQARPGRARPQKTPV